MTTYKWLFLCGLLGFAVAPQISLAQIEVANWPAPLYWASDDAPQGGKGSTRAASLSGPLPLVAITPCRLMDTRTAYASLGFTGPFGAPSLGGSFSAQRDVPVPQG